MSGHVLSHPTGDRVVLELRDEDSGASAKILPSYGFNLFDLKLPAGADGEPRPLVYAAEDWAARPDRPARNGFPVLFPFPNRIRDARFEWQGATYQLEANKPPHAIHGFALDADWELIGRKEGPDGASVTGRYRFRNPEPPAPPRWPGEGSLELTYHLKGRALTLGITVRNESHAPFPYGLGFHPYFRLPFSAKGDPARTRIVIPAARQWELKDAIPTGAIRPIENRVDFRAGKPIAGLEADDVLTGLEYDDQGFCVCRLVDETIGAEFRLGFDRNFREIVVFTPSDTPNVIAVEPYTQTTDAIHLQPQGIDAGLRVLEPGQSDAMTIRMETVG